MLHVDLNTSEVDIEILILLIAGTGIVHGVQN